VATTIARRETSKTRGSNRRIVAASQVIPSPARNSDAMWTPLM
jgi:hypothetical protein